MNELHTEVREPQNSVTKDVTEPLKEIGEVIKGLAAKNATMKDGKPEGSDNKDGRPPTTTEERVSAYEKFKATTAEIHASGASSGEKALAEIQAIVDLGVAVGPELASLAIDAIGAIGGLKK